MSATPRLFFIWLFCFLRFAGTLAQAADETFVGVLAFAVEEETAQQIGLRTDDRHKLQEFVDQREALALEVVLSMRDLPEAQQQSKLDAFRQESERMGLDLLPADARRALETVRLREAGMLALSEPSVAQRLQLSVAQQAEIGEILTARTAAVAAADPADTQQVQETYDRQLKAVLSKEQAATWTAATTPPATASRPSDTVPGEERVSTIGPPAVTRQGPRGSSAKLRFSFRYAPWQDVITWFAEQCELSLLMDAPPQGTFNYTDPREYSPSQAIDLLNSVLLTKGYTLVRREKMLQVVNLEDGIPPNLVPEVTEEKLVDLGEYELVRCVFTLQSVNAEDAMQEIERLLGPQGSVNVLTSSNQLAITETAGRLRTFQRILQQGERQSASALGQAKLLTLQHRRASMIIASWRKLMGLGADEHAAPDGSLRVVQGKSSSEVLVSGKPNHVREFEELVQILDVPSQLGPLDVPQLEVYPITEADPESVLQVMETLLEGADDLRLATDPKTGSLVALARPRDQQTIRATIEQLQSDRRQVEVIRLRSIDPQLAMLSIEKLFGPPPGEENPDAKGQPLVDADPVTRSLMIRGSEQQIEDIRTLLEKMGEDDAQGGRSRFGGITGDGNVRVLPVDAGTARRILDQMNTVWPTVRPNRIRTVLPSTRIRGIQTQQPLDSSSPLDDDETSEDTTSRPTRVATRFVAQAQQPTEPNTPSTTDATDSAHKVPDIVVTLGYQGLLISCEDTAVLDDFEELFLTLSNRLIAGAREFTIFYLRHAKAEVAGEFVKQFVGGASGSSGGSTLLGSLASAALGGSGGGIVGSLLGGGASASSGRSSGTSVIADPRLNALVVRATPQEMDFIAELLQLLDRPSSPATIETVPRPRSIPVLNADAEDVADVLRNVYSTRLAGGPSGGGNRQPSPEDFIKAMTGQKNTGKEIAAAIGEQVGVSISVDSRRNSLIVIAPESLFREIEELVLELDVMIPEREESIRYGSVAGASPEMIRQLVDTITGANEPRDQSNRQQKQPSSNNKASEPNRNVFNPNPEQIKRRMQFLQAIQKMNAQQQKAAPAKKAPRK